MLKSHQAPLSVEKQIEDLKDLELLISDENEISEFLNSVSYFRVIKGFGIGLKDSTGRFYTGVSFSNIKSLYKVNLEFYSFTKGMNPWSILNPRLLLWRRKQYYNIL